MKYNILIKLNLYLMLFYSYEIHNRMDYILHLQYPSKKSKILFQIKKRLNRY